MKYIYICICLLLIEKWIDKMIYKLMFCLQVAYCLCVYWVSSHGNVSVLRAEILYFLLTISFPGHRKVPGIY